MTHLFTSTVVRVKGTPLSSSTMKSRWQKGQWPVLSPSSLACRQRGRAQLPLRPSTAAVGAALAGQPQWVQREGGKPHTTHPGQAQAGCRLESSAGSPWHPLCWAGCQPLAPCLLLGPPHPTPEQPAWHHGCWPWHPWKSRGPQATPVPRGLGPVTVVAPGTAVAGDSPEHQGLCWRKVMVMLVALSPPGVIPGGPCPALCSQTNCPGQAVAGKGPAGAGRCCGG